MKQYIGTKQVKAEPMTRTEAEKLLGREIKPAKAEYGESVLVTNKETPEIVLKTSRAKGKGWNTDNNGFLCAVAFTITHWKPIEKLEE